MHLPPPHRYRFPQRVVENQWELHMLLLPALKESRCCGHSCLFVCCLLSECVFVSNLSSECLCLQAAICFDSTGFLTLLKYSQGDMEERWITRPWLWNFHDKQWLTWLNERCHKRLELVLSEGTSSDFHSWMGIFWLFLLYCFLVNIFYC